MTLPNIAVWLGNQAAQPGWMLSQDHGLQHILELDGYGTVLLGDPLGRAPGPQQHKLEFAHAVYARPDFDAYREDFQAVAQRIKTKTGSWPDVYVGGFHSQRFWLKQAATGRITDLLHTYLRLFRTNDDPTSSLLIRNLVVDGAGLACNNNWWEYCCNVAIAAGYPICANAQCDPGGLLECRPQYVESWIYSLNPGSFTLRFFGNSRIHILALEDTLTPDNLHTWLINQWNVSIPIGLWHDLTAPV